MATENVFNLISRFAQDFSRRSATQPFICKSKAVLLIGEDNDTFAETQFQLFQFSAAMLRGLEVLLKKSTPRSSKITSTQKNAKSESNHIRYTSKNRRHRPFLHLLRCSNKQKKRANNR